MSCAATDVFSYSEVLVTATTLTVTPKTAAGALVHEKTGGAVCPARCQSGLTQLRSSSRLPMLAPMLDERLIRFRPRAILIVIGVILAVAIVLEVPAG